jgi:hypothetical protein
LVLGEQAAAQRYRQVGLPQAVENLGHQDGQAGSRLLGQFGPPAVLAVEDEGGEGGPRPWCRLVVPPLDQRADI